MSEEKRLETPRAKGHWLFGSGAEMARDSLRFLADLGRSNGGFARFRLLHKKFVAVTDPECVHHILVTGASRYDRSFHSRNLGIIVGDGLLASAGAKWRKNRRQLQPQFRPDVMSRLVPPVTRAVEQLFKRWEAARQSGRAVQALTDMRRLTMSAMARIVFSIDLSAEDARKLDSAIRKGSAMLRRRNTSLVQLPLFIPTAVNRQLHASRRTLDEFVERHLGPRENGPQPDAPDMLNALFEARDPETGEALTHQELADQSKTLFVAGYETTGIGLTWTLYLLARHPHVAAGMREEVDRVLEGRHPTAQDLPKLTYTGQIIHESLRLYPPVYAIGRECVEDDEVFGHEMRKGWVAVISIFGMHHSAVWGADFETFRPERFAAGSGWPRHAFQPFASGKHVCLGNAFALTEMMVTLAMIGQRYELQLANDQPVEPMGLIGLVPEREIELRLVPRSGSPRDGEACVGTSPDSATS